MSPRSESEISDLDRVRWERGLIVFDLISDMICTSALEMTRLAGKLFVYEDEVLSQSRPLYVLQCSVMTW